MADNVQLNPGTGGDIAAADDVGGVKYQVVKLDLGGDGLSAPVVGAMPVTGALTNSELRASPVAISGALTNAELRAANVPTSNNATVFLFSTNNSSTAQLAAGATFIGVIETALDQPSISLLLASDQDMLVTVRQFIDLAGTRAAPNIVFPVAAGVGLARSMALNGNYVQILAQNVGASTTTTFNLNTAYGNLFPADNTGALPTTELPLIMTGQAAQTATVNNILTTTAGSAPLDVSGYRSASIQVISTGTAGTFIFEQSNDGVNWVALPVFNGALITGVPITTAITATNSSIIYSFALRCVYLRLRIATTITGGSIRAFSKFSTDPWTPSATLVANNTAANLQTTATVTAGTVNPVVPATPYFLNAAATTNGALIITGTSNVSSFYATNEGGAPAYVKLYNKATAPTVGTDVPEMTITVPAAVSGVPGVANLDTGFHGFRFALGLGIAVTRNAAHFDTTAIGAGEIKVKLSRTV